MKITQHSCKESNKVDLRQSNAIKRHKPDAIIFEVPFDLYDFDSKLNKFSPEKKNLDILNNYKKKLLRISKEYKWVKSDIEVINNIIKLWESGQDVKIYNVDGPQELVALSIKYKWDQISRPHRRGSVFPWWVYIYIREVIMTNNIRKILNSLPEDARVLIFLQKFHWINVQFQLNHKSKRSIFEYYFGNFDKVSMSNIDKKVKELYMPELYKFWQKYSKL